MTRDFRGSERINERRILKQILNRRAIGRDICGVQRKMVERSNLKKNLTRLLHDTCKGKYMDAPY
jgi:hypothetical protein